MSLHLRSPIVFVVIIILCLYLWKRYEEKQLFVYSNSPSYPRNMFEKYFWGQANLIKEEIGKIDKPILWIHVPYEYNARNWQSFGSRSSYELNQPYLVLTLKSIIDHCQEDFQIILVDDASFQKILDLTIPTSPMTWMQRQIYMLMLLEKYAGIILPLSFVCFRSLLPMLEQGTVNHRPFVAEKVNQQSTLNAQTIPDIRLMGTKLREDPEISALLAFLRKTEKSDMFTLAGKFEGSIPRYLSERIAMGEMNVIPAELVGTKTKEGKKVLIEDLLSHGSIHFDKMAYGIWIPSKQILERTNLQWFARMSQSQIVHSDFVLAKYLIVANDPNSFFSSPFMKFFSSLFQSTPTPTTHNQEGMQTAHKRRKKEKYHSESDSDTDHDNNNNTAKKFASTYQEWKGWWKTPLLPKGLYGTKPMYLGQDVPKSTFVK